MAGREYNIATRANYTCLRDAALNYARLLGRDLGHTPEGNTGACIADLYRKLLALEPQLNLNIEPVGSGSGNRLRFVFWKQADWGDYSLYYINARILEQLTPEMRAATLLFFRKLKRATGMDTTNESYDMDFILEMVEGEAESDPNNDDRHAGRSVVASYRKGGRVWELMREIEQPPEPDADLERTLAETRPRKRKEKELLDILREGRRFTERRDKTIFSYEYDPFHDEECEERPIEMERVIRFVYEADIVRQCLIDTLNDELNCGNGETVPCTSLPLTPDTDSVFREDPFPTEFFAWMDKLLECINNYSNDGLCE